MDENSLSFPISIQDDAPSIDETELIIFESLGMTTLPPTVSKNVIIDETFNGEMAGFDEAQHDLLRGYDPSFDKYIVGTSELDQTNVNEQCTVDPMAIMYDEQEILVGDTVTITDAPQQIEQKTIVKSSDVINSFNPLGSDNKKIMHVPQKMTVSVPPSPYQRVRSENESDDEFHALTVPYDGAMTITIPDLRNELPPGTTVKMRITRTMVKDDNDDSLLVHPYPIWMRNDQVKVANGSLFLPVTDQNMEQKSITIDDLTMVRTLQSDVSKINEFAVYTPTKLKFPCQPIILLAAKKRAKQIIEKYRLRQSMLIFQLVRVDKNNVVYLTDCRCQTEPIHEYEAKEFSALKPTLKALGVRMRQTPKPKRKKIGERKESQTVNTTRRISRQLVSTSIAEKPHTADQDSMFEIEFESDHNCVGRG